MHNWLEKGGYLERIWLARYFWLHLANAELKYKFRRSKLGMLWTMVNPLINMLILTTIFGYLFKIPRAEFAPYIFSGLVIWDFMLGSTVRGCTTLLNAEQYIKQYNHPLAIYPLKTTLVNLITFLIAIQALNIWLVATNSKNILFGLLTLPITSFCLFLLGWPLTIISSMITVKYRDFSQIIAQIMLAVYYVSPIFIKANMFKSPRLSLLMELNPITHVLNLVRAPLLYGAFPTLEDFFFIFGLATALSIVSVTLINRTEKTLIFYF